MLCNALRQRDGARRWLAAACSLLALAVAGCSTDKPGVTDTMGRYDQVINAPAARATQAATDVLDSDYHFKVLSSAYSTIDGKVEAESAQGMKVWVWVERKDDDSSTVSVRCGDMGDQKLSMEILDKIQDRSKTLMQKIREHM
jgi:hypothetical protein